MLETKTVRSFLSVVLWCRSMALCCVWFVVRFCAWPVWPFNRQIWNVSRANRYIHLCINVYVLCGIQFVCVLFQYGPCIQCFTLQNGNHDQIQQITVISIEYIKVCFDVENFRCNAIYTSISNGLVNDSTECRTDPIRMQYTFTVF